MKTGNGIAGDRLARELVSRPGRTILGRSRTHHGHKTRCLPHRAKQLLRLTMIGIWKKGEKRLLPWAGCNFLGDFCAYFLITLPHGMNEKGAALDLIGCENEHGQPLTTLDFAGARENSRGAATDNLTRSGHAAKRVDQLPRLRSVVHRKKNHRRMSACD